MASAIEPYCPRIVGKVLQILFEIVKILKISPAAGSSTVPVRYLNTFLNIKWLQLLTDSCRKSSLNFIKNRTNPHKFRLRRAVLL